MKMIRKSVVVAGVGMLVVTTMLAKGHSSQPVHTVHFTSKVVFTNDVGGTGTNGSGASATGQLSSSITANSDKESISINAKGLNDSFPYSLFATIGGSNLDLADFSSDKKGNAKLALKNTGSTKHPATLTGIEDFNITELDIVDQSDTNNPTTVLTADTTRPQTFTFSDKEAQTGTNGETGTLSITASPKAAKLSLTASGLNTNSPFLISLVGGTTASNTTFTSDSQGNLKASTAITANVLDLTEVDLTDTSSDVIIAFPLP